MREKFVNIQIRIVLNYSTRNEEPVSGKFFLRDGNSHAPLEPWEVVPVQEAEAQALIETRGEILEITDNFATRKALPPLNGYAAALPDPVPKITRAQWKQRQLVFARRYEKWRYLGKHNAAYRAAVDAGYSKATASQSAWRLLKMPHVQAEIANSRRKLSRQRTQEPILPI